MIRQAFTLGSLCMCLVLFQVCSSQIGVHDLTSHALLYPCLCCFMSPLLRSPLRQIIKFVFILGVPSSRTSGLLGK